MTDIAGTSMYEFLKYALHWIYEFVTRTVLSTVNSEFSTVISIIIVQPKQYTVQSRFTDTFGLLESCD